MLQIFLPIPSFNKNKVLQKQQEKAEKNMDVIQDAIAADQDIEYNQQAMMDLIGQQTSKMQEGLDEEFDQLGEEDALHELNQFNGPAKDEIKQPAQKNTSKESSYDAMMKDLLA